jgi:hypothetical protein
VTTQHSLARWYEAWFDESPEVNFEKFRISDGKEFSL